jgi:hypothetical protein
VRYLVRTWLNEDVRECILVDGFYVHVLNSAWRIEQDSLRVRSVKVVEEAK